MGFLPLPEGNSVKELFDQLVQAIKARKKLRTIALLVSMYPEVLERQDGSKMTVLAHASCLTDPCCSSEVMAYLITQCPLSLSKLNNDGHAPLHHASWRAYPLEIIQLLIYENSLGHKSTPGDTALRLACVGKTISYQNIHYLASQWPAACLIETQKKLPLDLFLNEEKSKEIQSLLTQCTMDSIIALVDIVEHDKTAVPWRVGALVAVYVFDLLDCHDSSNKAEEAKTTLTEQDMQNMCSYLRNADIQKWLEETRHQKLINGFVKMTKVRCKESSSSSTDQKDETSKNMQILECVTDNTDCLFLYLRDNLKMIHNSPLQSIKEMGSLMAKEVHRSSRDY